MDNKNKLSFVVIGAQKCATTWLYDCLKEHPGLNVRNSKNEDIYFGSKWMQENGSVQYFAQFNQNKTTPKGCVSVEYIEDSTTVASLHKHNADLKIIVSLRRPEQRAISAYQWYVRKATIPNINLNQGLIKVLEHFNKKEKNEYTAAYNNIIERGFYVKRLIHWFEIFPAHQIYIQFFDEVQLNPKQAIVDIFKFLELDEKFTPVNVSAKPKKNTGFSPLILLQRKFPNSTIIGKIVDKSNQLFFSKNAVKPELTIGDETINDLKNIYEKSVEDLGSLLATYQPLTNQKLKTLWNLKSNQ